MSIALKPPDRVRKRARNFLGSEGKGQSIHYNCTTKLPKYYIRCIFDEKSGRMRNFLDVIADATYKAYKEEKSKERIDKSP